MRVIDDVAVGPYERVVHAVDEPTGLRAVVALHSTALGPAIGGCRFWPYPSEASAVIDAMRLAEGMTMKAAAAGLDLGGGKAVIVGDPARIKTPWLLRAFAKVVSLFEGAYYTAEDVGTSVEDMEIVREYTPYVVGLREGRLGGGGDPSPLTSRGVLAAMRGAWEEATGSRSLEAVSVVVIGVGKVGGGLARRLAAEGARLMVSDVDRARAEALAGEIGAGVLDPEGAPFAPCDILAPCALGGLLTPASVAALNCRWVVGAANNQLASDAVAQDLADRGIGYVPDFVANAGGLISVAEELRGWDAARVGRRVDAIRETVRDLVRDALPGETLLAAARRRAMERIAGRREDPPGHSPPAERGISLRARRVGTTFDTSR
jgi:leucine dehydrogenase